MSMDIDEDKLDALLVTENALICDKNDFDNCADGAGANIELILAANIEVSWNEYEPDIFSDKKSSNGELIICPF